MRKLLFPVSWVWTIAALLKDFLYRQGMLKSWRAPVSVISVGNIQAGGTGKTPFCEYLIRLLLEEGYRPAFLSRGYGRTTTGYRIVDAARDGADAVGDEALQVARHFPDVKVAVCEDRKAGIIRLLESEVPDVILLDDAFQHRRVARDLDIVLVDGSREAFGFRMLPAGDLREPFSALSRAGMVILTKPVANATAIRGIHADASFDIRITALHTEEGDYAPSGSFPACVFSGLGNNAHFRRSLENAGAEVMTHLAWGDHHPYSAQDIEGILNRFADCKARSGDRECLCITSAKDFARLSGQDRQKFRDKGVKLWVAEAGIGWIQGETEVKQKVREAIRNGNKIHRRG